MLKSLTWGRRGEWLELRLPEREEISFDLEKILSQELPAAFLKKLKREEGIRLDAGRLLLRLFPREETELEGSWEAFERIGVLYEDDFCLVADKPAGMPVHPGGPEQDGTLAHAVAFHYSLSGSGCRIRHVHRLDTDTTGPVLYAKNELAHIRLDEAMREKKIRRDYAALALGRFEPVSGLIDAPIGRDRHHPKRQRVSSSGNAARTRYQVVKQSPSAAWVELTLETGRTHQIRVHLSHMGHPIVGDALYGGPTRLFDRQALHGQRLVFPHPWTGEMVEIVSPPPKDFEALWHRLQEGAKP